MKTINLTPKQLKLLNFFLKELADNYSNAGCNDLPPELDRMFNKKEKQEIIKELNAKDGGDKESLDFDIDLLEWIVLKINQ